MHYFDHDTSASGDDKIIALRLECGGAAVDAYWSILEMIYDSEGPLDLSDKRPLTQSLSHRLAVGVPTLKNWVHEMVSLGLLDTTSDDGSEECITSERAMKRISEYQRRLEKNRENGRKGGQKSRRKPSAKSRRKASGKRPLSECLPDGKQEVSAGQANIKGFISKEIKPIAKNSASLDDAALSSLGYVPSGTSCGFHIGTREWRHTPDEDPVCPKCHPERFRDMTQGEEMTH